MPLKSSDWIEGEPDLNELDEGQRLLTDQGDGLFRNWVVKDGELRLSSPSLNSHDPILHHVLIEPPDDRSDLDKLIDHFEVWSQSNLFAEEAAATYVWLLKSFASTATNRKAVSR